MKDLVPQLETCRRLEAARYPGPTTLVWTDDHVMTRNGVDLEGDVIAPTAQELFVELDAGFYAAPGENLAEMLAQAWLAKAGAR